jgi:hypothetical protein
MRQYINTFEYHVNIVIHREVCAIESAVNKKLICLSRDTPGSIQQRRKYTGISSIPIQTHIRQRLLILMDF